MSKINKQAIIIAYKKNKSISAIAIDQNCSRTYIYEVLKKANVLHDHKVPKTKKQKIYDAIIRACNEMQCDLTIAESVARRATAKILTIT